MSPVAISYHRHLRRLARIREAGASLMWQRLTTGQGPSFLATAEREDRLVRLANRQRQASQVTRAQ